MDELLIFSEIIPQLEKILEVWQIDVGLLFVGCCKPLGWSTRVYTLDGKWKLGQLFAAGNHQFGYARHSRNQSFA